MSILATIQSPGDLKGLSSSELGQLCAEIRAMLIGTVSKTGGHLAPNLGVVELTVGIYRALDFPRDLVTYDVGHQSYVHKLLTGRFENFDTLRTYGGISGFPNRKESPYDLFGSGHASDSLSIALGYALARCEEEERAAKSSKKKKKTEAPHIVALIGDGSLTGGMAWEALNHIGHLGTRMTIMLNDNEMSIAPNVGALAGYLGRIRLDRRYWAKREFAQRQLERGKLGRALLDVGTRAKDSFKHMLVPGMVFEELGHTYVGPIDGHDIDQVEAAVKSAAMAPGPVIIHAVTQKGRGYGPAELNPTLFHGIGAFEVSTGKPHSKPGTPPTYMQVFGEAVTCEAQADPRIVALTAAMPSGTGLDIYRDYFENQPGRFFDVGIAEEHAVGLAAGLAMGGKLPVVAIYSTFLQRAYDQIITDVALQNLHVVFAIDRGGYVGDDGPTHHGVHDLSYLRTIPTMQILVPADEVELVDALHTALTLEGPVAVRYPRGTGEGLDLPELPRVWEYAKAQEEVRAQRPDVVLMAVGRMLPAARAARELLAKQGIDATVSNMRWVKPLDEEYICEAARMHKLVVTLEENTVRGGFGSGVMEVLCEAGITKPLLQIGTPDQFAVHGTVDQLLTLAGLDAESIAARVTERFASLS